MPRFTSSHPHRCEFATSARSAARTPSVHAIRAIRFIALSANVGPEASCCARDSDAEFKSSSLVTKLITPQRSNTSGLYRRPSMAISLARAGPALSVNRCTAPSNGASPIATSTEPIRADWAATIKSLARASSKPPPSTAPERPRRWV